MDHNFWSKNGYNGFGSNGYDRNGNHERNYSTNIQ